ncbi:hypothetical protein [Nocardiopsis algeriensis]|uniref:Secreted protein n=1 Tax=Nocardiopsis algeriensis TaxID=1478215 RepID=A0A841IPU8_9ACTN|nr:hypothetical protein [Nocardiopsis algeriensis]MBB6120210.1 hypothetical protein [Nocardiopsis algeriensis]
MELVDMPGSASRGLAVLAALSLLVPAGPAQAEDAWIRFDPGSADRVGLAADPDALRVDAARGRVGTSSRVAGRAQAPGLATFPGQDLDRPTDTVDVRLRVEGGGEEGVRAEVRGVRPDGMWTEWHPVPGTDGRIVLPGDVRRVQLRVGITEAGTEVTDVRVRPRDDSGDPFAEVPREPFSSRLFATRIGLVGDLTANGHTIRPDDHFAALPSRRALAVRGGGEYTVRVCTTGLLGPGAEGDTQGHEPLCAYLPVWDVGPWNIADDHWNAERETWPELERGLPQAQAAYADGHNGGLDGFGRRVRNPAGIDLADGAFAALGLPTNGWVDVDHLWTGGYLHRAEAVSGSGAPVTLHAGPGPEHEVTGLAASGANVDVLCRLPEDPAPEAHAPEVYGHGSSAPAREREWYRIGDGHHLPADSAVGGESAPTCT